MVRKVTIVKLNVKAGY